MKSNSFSGRALAALAAMAAAFGGATPTFSSIGKPQYRQATASRRRRSSAFKDHVDEQVLRQYGLRPGQAGFKLAKQAVVGTMTKRHG
jgi:hypothetical protein